MLPIKDDIPSFHYPAVTMALIALNVLAFFIELSLGPELEGALWHWALIPARYTDSGIRDFFSPTEQLLPFFSSMFLHGGWVHLIGNMWMLWIFGDNVEDRLGPGRYLFFYLLGGVVAGALHIITNMSSPLPTIGASGAVAAVMGAYFRFYPHARVLMLAPPFFFGPLFLVSAVLFLGAWFLLQFFNGALSVLAGQGGFEGIAWWAHIGGFAFGVLLCSRLGLRHAPKAKLVNDEDRYWWCFPISFSPELKPRSSALIFIKPMNRPTKVKCPMCRKEGDWFGTPHGPFCSRRCKLVDLGRWFNEENCVSEPLRPEHFEGYENLPPGEYLDNPEADR